jgi:hypothetical protein
MAGLPVAVHRSTNCLSQFHEFSVTGLDPQIVFSVLALNEVAANDGEALKIGVAVRDEGTAPDPLQKRDVSTTKNASQKLARRRSYEKGIFPIIPVCRRPVIGTN